MDTHTYENVKLLLPPRHSRGITHWIYRISSLSRGEAVSAKDFPALAKLNDLAHACSKNSVHLVICGLNHQPLDIAQRCGFVTQVGAANIYPTLATGMAAALTH